MPHTTTSPVRVAPSALGQTSQPRIASIDALRGLVLFTMIFVNDLAGAPNSVVPSWMKHFHGRSGMTFVDLVFPAFLFIVGMSVPFALGSRLKRGEPLWRIAGHVLVRTASLLAIGILMVNETPDSDRLGWSGALWSILMYLSAILAFSSYSPHVPSPAKDDGRTLARMFAVPRLIGLAALLGLAVSFRGRDGHRIIQFAPFAIHASWYGILGLIAWAYLVTAIVFLVFGTNRTALLGCLVLLMCLYPAERTGMLQNFWLSHYVGIGAMLGSQAAISVAGLLLASKLAEDGRRDPEAGVRFSLWFIVGCSAGAWLLHGLYGINKNQATPSWCLWACAITTALWLALYALAGLGRGGRWVKPLVIAGQNVFLAYLLSEMLPSLLDWLGAAGWYDRLAVSGLLQAIARSVACSILILGASVGLNRLGFRLKL
jgi:heparan-alpha-glucosaminide N-acetyltransferase